MKLFALLVVSFFSFSAFATFQDDVVALKDTARDYFDTGAICEEIARLDMQEEFPAPQFKVLTGISYDNGDGTAGELDVIVFDMHLNKVIKIAEVKCWKKLDHALIKAQKQRARFLGYRANSANISYKKAHSSETFTKEQFADVNDFITIGQQGALAFDFDRELKYSLRDFAELRDLMMKCQHDGLCAKKK